MAVDIHTKKYGLFETALVLDLGLKSLPPLFVISGRLKKRSMGRRNIEVQSFVTYPNYDTPRVTEKYRDMLPYNKDLVAFGIKGKRDRLRNGHLDSMRASMTSSNAPKIAIHILDTTISLPIFLNTGNRTFADHESSIQVDLIAFILESLHIVLNNFYGKRFGNVRFLDTMSVYLFGKMLSTQCNLTSQGDIDILANRVGKKLVLHAASNVNAKGFSLDKGEIGVHLTLDS